MTDQPNQPDDTQPEGDDTDAAFADLTAQLGELGDTDLADEATRLRTLVDERTSDLQRVQAEYVNYRKRVERDRSLAKQSGIEAVVRDLMPVLDSVREAEAHEELSGGMKVIADELVRLAGKYGLTAFGQTGDEFDPHHHEALMQQPVAGTGEMTLHEVLQPGYELGGQVIRPARVIVAVPDGTEPEPEPESGQ